MSSINQIKNYRKAGTIYNLGHTGILLKLVSLNHTATLAANDYRLIAAYPCGGLSSKYRNMTSPGPIDKTERYRKKSEPIHSTSPPYPRFHILSDPTPGIREASYQSHIEISPGWGSREFRIPRPSCSKRPL